MMRFNKILCVVDPEDSADTAIIQAAEIAADHQSDITFVSVLKQSRVWRSPLVSKEDKRKGFDNLMETRQEAIEKRVKELAPGLKPKIEVDTGIAFIQIIKSVLNNNYDLVVKCAEDSDWIDQLFGSEDMHLIRKCPCPVLMLKPGQNKPFKKILATVDVNEDVNETDNARVQQALNRQVLACSTAFCMPDLTEMHVASAWEAYAEDFYRHGAFSQMPKDVVDRYVNQVQEECNKKLNQLMKEMSGMLGKDAVNYLSPKLHLIKGKPSKVIPETEKRYGIDLIVMGTVGRVGIPGFIIGNTAETILKQVTCSVLAIKPEGFVSPVE